MKTTQVELREVAGAFDDKVKTDRTGDEMRFEDAVAGQIKLNDLRLGPVKAQTVTVAKSGAHFTTIQSAIDSITDATAAKPYVVAIYPGLYEPASMILLTKSYVSLIGIQPHGAKIIEAQNSGVVIKRASSGAGGDLMTMAINSDGDIEDLEGITIANLTIINTAPFGTGGAQMALNIGVGDTNHRNHEILIKNCSLFGEQDTVFVNNGKPVFQNCYIEGEVDICSVAWHSVFERVYFYCHTSTGQRTTLWLGRSGHVSFTVTFLNCVFDTALSDSSPSVGHWGHSNVTANFYNCALMPNSAYSAWRSYEYTGTINLYNTNGAGWPTGANFIEQQQLNSSGDSNVKGGLNVGTATGAPAGSQRISGRTSVGTDQSKAPLQGGNTGLPSALAGTTALFDSEGSVTRISIIANDGGQSICQYGDDSDEDVGAINYNHATNIFEFRLNGGTRIALGPTGDIAPLGFLSTHGHELLATDILRHEITAADVIAENFTEAWTEAIPSKLVSIITGYLETVGIFASEAYTGMKAFYDATDITVEMGAYPWSEHDIVTIQIVYSK